MRHLSGLAIFASATLALGAGYQGPGPVRNFPARYSDGEAVVYEMWASNGQQNAHQTRRRQFSDVLVFDDETTLRFVGAASEPFPTVATWRPLSARAIRFTYTPETAAAAREYVRDGLGTVSGFRMRIGRGRLDFAKGGASYRGTQSMRATGRYRGIWFTMEIQVAFSGTRQ